MWLATDVIISFFSIPGIALGSLFRKTRNSYEKKETALYLHHQAHLKSLTDCDTELSIAEMMKKNLEGETNFNIKEVV